MDKDTISYLQWKDHQQEPLIEIGDYYFILIYYVYNAKNFPSYIFFKQIKDTYSYLSFLKKDINLVYEYCKHNTLLSYKYANQYLIETLEKLINKEN